jgi:hypothetical protein
MMYDFVKACRRNVGPQVASSTMPVRAAVAAPGTASVPRLMNAGADIIPITQVVSETLCRTYRKT